MTLTRLESFPFDSRYDGYDDDGYPVYDRAVGAKTMRDVFAHFFTDGVFVDGTYPFRLTKAASGLAVTVNPGVVIINGGWGILREQTTLTLATGTTAGVIKYAVFARYDNNDEHRTIYLRTDASSAGGAVPEPSTAEANVTEYRIGYITVPSNSTDLIGATVTNEVGTSKCPYATPLFDIDPDEVLEDLRNDAQAAYDKYHALLQSAYDKYHALLQSAVDDTTAGHLQNQIDEQGERIATLEENQFTQESIDAQALRAEMGLGNTTGVLGVEYGGTGRSTPPTTGLVCSFDLVATKSLPTTKAESYTITPTISNLVIEDEAVVAYENNVLSFSGHGFYRIEVSGTAKGTGGTIAATEFTGASLLMSLTVAAGGKVYSFPSAASASPFGGLLGHAVTESTQTTNPIKVAGLTSSFSKTTDGLNDPFANFNITLPGTATIYPSIKHPSGTTFGSTNSSTPFIATMSVNVKIYRVLAL